MPSVSSAQSSGCCCTVPEQQRSVALHEFDARRQIAPAGLQAFPLSQRPTVAPGAFSQRTSVLLPPPDEFVEPAEPSAPQQSLSERQSSPVGWHPLGGWQTKTPVAAQGRHEREQQSPPQLGIAPPSPVVADAHTCPAETQPGTPPPVGATLHVPSAAPAALVHAPPQHSVSLEHTSPSCVQNDGFALHTPP